ncbi:glycine betaine ABC transporter substrate-binding protein [Zymobacter palmae]|uniref:Substrate-binding region of ABC-type glycine betaine transport system n=1 Tax=Zymobacter palmae TaxID=33074 RepID=A0A348HH72_9GAMM|nr:glycine betaine ABC transporter substrate-binding protein [Zymobacter palmae]BBG30974.1 substrate-binding region of ABC-type glycine betaine transport system [Zymobacter palmae]
MKTLISTILTAALISGAVLTAPSASATEPLGQQDITIGYVAWADQMPSTYAMKVVLEQQGYHVKPTTLSAAFMWQGVAQGKLDMIAAWLPVTHGAYYAPVKEKVENLGANFTGAHQGLAVPAYLTDINTIDDLKQHADEFEGKVVGIDPGAGLMRLTKRALDQYGVNMKLAASSDATMTAVLGEAIREHRPVVVTAWTPHWMFNRWQLKYLDDPKGAFGSDEEIDTIVRKGLRQDSPRAYCVLSHFKWTPAEMGELLAMNEQPNSDPYQNAKQWVDKHPELVARWTQGCQ